MKPVVLVGCGLSALLAAQPLTLEEVLRSVEANYPPLLATLLERDNAAGAARQAEGAFDLNLGARAGADRFGYYENERLDFSVSQNFRWNGASAFAGYRTSFGELPPYRGQEQTRSLGEWRAGFNLPLARGREIDERRAALAQTQIGLRLAELTVDQQRLVVRQLASNRYWDWVAAGQRLRIAQDLLRVAEERQSQLTELSEAGAVAEIEVIENRRQIFQRQGFVVQARRGLEQAAIALSLFYRDSAGGPRLATEAQLPGDLPATMELTPEQVAADLRLALRKRPEIQAVAAQREQARIDIHLADNQTRPSLDLGMGVTAEAGSGDVRRGPNEVKATLTFQLPFQRRVAEGKLEQATAKYSQLTLREGFARDTVTAEVRDAASAVQAAHQRARLAMQEVTVALQLADLERDRFQLGDSDLIRVNIREQQAVDAELSLVAANLEYIRALVTYQQVTAQLLP
jgi:outer membrane protein TolC